ncbi:unnamed protein product [Enterobius vermicularis]|uniref:Acyl_transf_3 domain-containing protein n=1 Tax=Enterobius vermicularis TaxID=51028 RepID=A0A0N4VQU3_ENTVE|nr:unnamed protein product [Enterobius vermicularis]
MKFLIGKVIPKKRKDIQGLRGLAIIYVLAFHLYPQLFPRGFLGVDIFFVISGYLISLILMREKSFTLTSFLVFYKKRIKRIFPAYYVMLFFLFSFGYYLLAAEDYFTLQVDSAWAVGFLTNIHKYLQNLDYFAEVLYYAKYLQIQVFLNFINFFEGFKNTPLLVAGLFSLSPVAFMLPLHVTFLRLLCTLGAATVIYLGNEFTSNFVLGNSYLYFIGEISYSVYLYHWPIITFVMYYTDTMQIAGILVNTNSLILFYLIVKRLRNTFSINNSVSILFIMTLSAHGLSLSTLTEKNVVNDSRKETRFGKRLLWLLTNLSSYKLLCFKLYNLLS